MPSALFVTAQRTTENLVQICFALLNLFQYGLSISMMAVSVRKGYLRMVEVLVNVGANLNEPSSVCQSVCQKHHSKHFESVVLSLSLHQINNECVCMLLLHFLPCPKLFLIEMGKWFNYCSIMVLTAINQTLFEILTMFTFHFTVCFG